MFIGEIPDGLLVRHKCDNRLCVNPEHLELGTIQDNVNDREIRGRGSKGESRPSAKLNAQQALEIFHAEGKYKDIAKVYNISKEVVCQIKNKRKWKSVTS